MSNVTRRNKSLDYLLVVLDERWQISYWITALRCNERELREAVAAVGPLVADVRRYLASNRQQSDANPQPPRLKPDQATPQ